MIHQSIISIKKGTAKLSLAPTSLPPGLKFRKIPAYAVPSKHVRTFSHTAGGQVPPAEQAKYLTDKGELRKSVTTLPDCRGSE